MRAAPERGRRTGGFAPSRREDHWAPTPPVTLKYVSASTESGTVAVLAEKPSVARDIARVLGAANKGDGYLHGNGYVVTWAIGHLAALAQPHEIDPEWRHWRRSLLPMLPTEWPLVVYEQTKDQFETVRKILNSPRVGSLVGNSRRSKRSGNSCIIANVRLACMAASRPHIARGAAHVL